MKLQKTIALPSGTQVLAGTELHFSNEGVGYYEGEEINRNLIPKAAIEEEIVVDQVDTLTVKVDDPAKLEDAEMVAMAKEKDVVIGPWMEDSKTVEISGPKQALMDLLGKYFGFDVEEMSDEMYTGMMKDKE